MFCGRFVEGKRPLFALSVANRVAGLLGRRVSILMVGSGHLEGEMREWLSDHQNVNASFTGFLRQEQLPAAYRSAKVFLFPTASDAWGVVVNEAAAAGLPVVCSPNAGVAGDLIQDGESGFVADFYVDAWAERVSALLTDKALRERVACTALERVRRLTFEDAADGIRKAIHAVLADG
jgi:glycosyltransferase involved in cell wall biosynthesis